MLLRCSIAVRLLAETISARAKKRRGNKYIVLRSWFEGRSLTVAFLS
jgi:hypothetical protein